MFFLIEKTPVLAFSCELENNCFYWTSYFTSLYSIFIALQANYVTKKKKKKKKKKVFIAIAFDFTVNYWIDPVRP